MCLPNLGSPLKVSSSKSAACLHLALTRVTLVWSYALRLLGERLQHRTAAKAHSSAKQGK